MLSITLKSYDEFTDTFVGATFDMELDTIYDMNIPAALLPYIAKEQVAATEDLPHGMIGQVINLVR